MTPINLFALSRGFNSPYFIGYSLLGIFLFVIFTVLKYKLKNPKNSLFVLLKVFIGFIYLVGFFVMVFVIFISTVPIRFM